METALRWLAGATPATAELLRLMDATPVPCGTSAVTARRSDLYGWAGYGYCPSHSRWYWGAKLLIMCTCDGTVTGFGLANPKLFGEPQQARQMLERQPANRPAPGTAVVTDKGLSGEDTEEFFASDDLQLRASCASPHRSGGVPTPGWRWAMRAAPTPLAATSRIRQDSSPPPRPRPRTPCWPGAVNGPPTRRHCSTGRASARRCGSLRAVGRSGPAHQGHLTRRRATLPSATGKPREHRRDHRYASGRHRGGR
jgi:hypothetical protein